jgi:hypothetical protein
MIKDGKSPIYVRLTIDGLQEEMSSGIKVSGWSKDKKQVLESKPNHKLHNKRLRQTTAKALASANIRYDGRVFRRQFLEVKILNCTSTKSFDRQLSSMGPPERETAIITVHCCS